MNPENKHDDEIRPGNPKFQEGYIAGIDDPGFITKTQPEEIRNPYPAGTIEHKNYEAGYRAAIE